MLSRIMACSAPPAGQRAQRRRGGFTLLEIAIVVALVGLVLGSTFDAVFRSEVFSGHFTLEGVVEETGWRVTNRLGEEFAMAYPDSVQPPILIDLIYVEYQEVLGYTGGLPDLSNYYVIAWEPAEGEIGGNGADDNSDGRIDEGYITKLDTGGTTKLGAYPDWSSYPDSAKLRLAGNVIGARFNAVVGGISWSVDIGLIDRDGDLVSDTFTRQVAYRN